MSWNSSEALRVFCIAVINVGDSSPASWLDVPNSSSWSLMESIASMGDRRIGRGFGVFVLAVFVTPDIFRFLGLGCWRLVFWGKLVASLSSGVWLKYCKSGEGLADSVGIYWAVTLRVIVCGCFLVALLRSAAFEEDPEWWSEWFSYVNNQHRLECVATKSLTSIFLLFVGPVAPGERGPLSFGVS